MIRLMTPSEITRLAKAIEAHYDNFTIDPFSGAAIGEPFFLKVPPAAPYDIQIYQYVRRLNMLGWHPRLINAFLAEHPEHEGVLNLSFDLGMGAKIYQDQPDSLLDRVGLESLVNSYPSLDVTLFLKAISLAERCVCRVEIELADGGKKWGTGFLVGPDLVLSNYHVFEPYIKNPGTVTSIVCRFDYNVTAEGAPPEQGRTVEIVPKPVVAYSPYSQMDIDDTPSLATSWPSEHLDYALVQLKEKVGEEAVGAVLNTPAKSVRGFIAMTQQEPTLVRGGHMYIIQHPRKKPKKIAFGFGKVEGMDPDKQRVRYKVDTEDGSSGSPCFDHKYQLVALHHLGDPSWIPTYNQGIPIFRIAQDLQKKGVTL